MRATVQRAVRVQVLLRAERARTPVAVHTALAEQAADGEGTAEHLHAVPQLVRPDTRSSPAGAQFHARRAICAVSTFTNAADARLLTLAACTITFRFFFSSGR